MSVTQTSARLTADAALIAVKRAVREAEKMGAAINAAVVDEGGNLLAFLRGDGAFLGSGPIAQDKAYTAVAFKMPSGKLYAALEQEKAVLTGITGQPRVAAFPGGLPIWDGDQLVGAIGVSGATAEQDEACAMAGLEEIGLNPE